MDQILISTTSGHVKELDRSKVCFLSENIKEMIARWSGCFWEFAFYGWREYLLFIRMEFHNPKKALVRENAFELINWREQTDFVIDQISMFNEILWLLNIRDPFGFSSCFVANFPHCNKIAFSQEKHLLLWSKRPIFNRKYVC